ncbi:fluoride efflux transporter CrcB [Tenuifilum thalassicum]|uniref:Fluoride-specific ion channel FluC n=1 Tax=Tenuifilum thalassicum TaxID=2590900 RepID=A0A7D3XU49_9BACT|nr:fluoride efflux transporter CrcB [Tenuifilum thalassicum]QKG78748.1 fluoride efflux transporter CrcB [Tenuifilum thalassicum]
MFKSVLIVGLGGFIGSASRFLVSRYFQLQTLSDFPWGTFTVNIVGSLIIGLVYGLSERSNFLSPELRLFLAVGFCGGFTTFSSFANDMLLMLQGRELFHFIIYSGASFILGLVSVFIGRYLVQIL